MVASILALAGAGLGAAEDTRTPVRWKANPRISERSGAAGSWFLAWTANTQARPHHYNAYLYETDSGIRWRLNDRGTEGMVGDFLGEEIVLTQWRSGRPGNLFKTTVWAGPLTGFSSKVNTPANELHPTISGRWLLFTRYVASIDTHRVLLFNRKNKALRTLASASGPGAVYAGQVRGDFATWYTWGPEQSDVFRYRISTRRTVKIPRPPRIARQYGSSVAADGTMYFNRRAGDGCGTSPELVMRRLGRRTRLLYDYPAGKDGVRTTLDAPLAWTRGHWLRFAVITCAAPPYRASDVWAIRVPSNPLPS